MAKLTDDSLMPFGKHKGKRMVEVPAAYLLYIAGTYPLQIRGGPEVAEYVRDNEEVLIKEAKEKYKPL